MDWSCRVESNEQNQRVFRGWPLSLLPPLVMPKRCWELTGGGTIREMPACLS